MYDTPFDRSFLQLSNGIRHVMPSTDKARINSIGLDGSASHRRLCVPVGLLVSTDASMGNCIAFTRHRVILRMKEMPKD